MTWNHRVIAHDDETSVDGVWLAIHEVHYANGKPISMTQNPASLGGEDLAEIRKTLQLMIDCLSKPVLTEEEIAKTKTND